MSDRVGARDLAEQLGISRQYVHKLTTAGVLSHEVNDRGWFTYDRDEAAAEYARFNAVKKGATSLDNDDQCDEGGVDDGTLDLKVERARQELRIKRATADMKELERDEMFGKYHRAEFVEDAFDEYVFAVRSAVLALPGKLAPALAPDKKTTARFAAIIEDEVKSMLESLSSYEYSAEYYRDRLSELTGLGAQDDS